MNAPSAKDNQRFAAYMQAGDAAKAVTPQAASSSSTTSLASSPGSSASCDRTAPAGT